MANSLNEKVAIVTGGGSGIGEGLCRELARRGARVIVADINSAEAGRVAASITGIGGQAAGYRLQKSQPNSRIVRSANLRCRTRHARRI